MTNKCCMMDVLAQRENLRVSRNVEARTKEEGTNEAGTSLTESD